MIFGRFLAKTRNFGSTPASRTSRPASSNTPTTQRDWTGPDRPPRQQTSLPKIPAHSNKRKTHCPHQDNSTDQAPRWIELQSQIACPVHLLPAAHEPRRPSTAAQARRPEWALEGRISDFVSFCSARRMLSSQPTT